MNTLFKFLLCLTAFGLLSCDNKNLKAFASTEVEKIHKHFNEEHFSEIIMGATTKIKDAKGFLPYIERKRSELGVFQQGKIVYFRKSRSEPDSWLDLRLDSRFEKGNAKERFIFIVTPQGIQLQDYEIDYQ